MPITSSLVESTVKQINHRVKGTEKFWTEAAPKASCSYADQLSDGVLEKFWQRRQEGANGRRRYRRQAGSITASLPTDLPSRPQDDRKTTLLEENQGQLKMT